MDAIDRSQLRREQPDDDRPRHYARRWKTLGVLSLSLVIIGLDNTILNVALPTLQHEFDASPSQLQWMVDSYLLVFAGLLLVFGTLGDRFGRKRALQAGISIFGLASLGALIADSADQVIAVRAAMGVGAALIMPATLSIIANLFTGEERRKAIAIWAALAAVGIGLGPLAGGLLLEWFDWSSVFMVNVPFAAAALAARHPLRAREPRSAARLVRPARRRALDRRLQPPRVRDHRGARPGLDLRSHRRTRSRRPSRLLGAFLWWERRIDEPMLDLGFFRSASFSVGTAAVSVAFFALLGGIFALTQYLQFVHGYSAIEAGAIMSPIALGLMIGAGSSSKAAERLGASRVVAVGLAGLATMLALTTLWAPQTERAHARPLVLRPRAGDGLGHGSRHGRGRRRGARGQVGRRLGHQHRRAHGLGSTRRRRDRLARQLALLERRGRLARRSARRRRRPAPRTRSARPARSPRSSPATPAPAVLATTGDAFTQAMGIGLLLGAALAAVAAVIVARFLPSRQHRRGRSGAHRRPHSRRLRARLNAVRSRQKGTPMQHRVVVVGGGFGGLQVVRHLRRAPVSITLVDRQNFTLFQPLAYQVATGALSAAEIASPLRAIVKRQENTRVVLAEVDDIDLRGRRIFLGGLPNGRERDELAYDTLVVAAGAHYSYFGHPEWQAHAPELKSLDGTLDIRSRILSAFEAAEVEEDAAQPRELAHIRRRRRWPDRRRDGRPDRRARPRDAAARLPSGRSARGARPARRGRRAPAPELPRVALAQGDPRPRAARCDTARRAPGRGNHRASR